MPGDFLLRKPQLTMEQFHAFRDERPKEEKWELIDGVPLMMAPPTLVHQRICANLDRMLNSRLETVTPKWRADREVGIWVGGDDKFNPEPDVTVIDTAILEGQIYVQRFYFVAEVLSNSDKEPVIDSKLQFYKAHEHALAIMFVRQNRFHAELHVRRLREWEKRVHKAVDEVIDLPEIGPIGRVGDLYRFTPLDPFGGT